MIENDIRESIIEFTILKRNQTICSLVPFEIDCATDEMSLYTIDLDNYLTI